MFQGRSAAHGVLCFIVALAFLISGTIANDIHLDAATPTASWLKCIVAKNHVGYSGNGYLDFQDKGAWVEWNVVIEQEGEYEVMARYTSRNFRSADLIIDGKPEGTFSFPGTLNFPAWVTESIVITSLAKGTHKIRVYASISTGPDLDSLSIRPKKLNIAPTSPPTTAKTVANQEFQSITVLESGGFLSRNEFVWSPSKTFRVGLSSAGALVMVDAQHNVVWNAGVNGGRKLWMQSDGNMIVRDRSDAAIWVSRTSHHDGAHCELDDGGQVSVVDGNFRVWLDGVPRGTYTGPSSPDLQFPVRAAFYYAWYPETWTVGGKDVKFLPSMGKYLTGTSDVVEAHVDALDYAHVDMSIVSWWGPDQTLERSRLLQLMDETLEQGSPLKWSVYHEDERHENDSPGLIRQDLDYLKKWYAWHPSYAHVDGRPVIFVYNEGGSGGCDVARRWNLASKGEWYVVLKIFPGYENCPFQPDSWHQYGPATATIHVPNYSYSISPGFWKADVAQPLLPRVDKATWTDNVKKMVNSNEPWQLITTFNEAGEGTLVESSPHWASSTGYGWYLDILHQFY